MLKTVKNTSFKCDDSTLPSECVGFEIFKQMWSASKKIIPVIVIRDSSLMYCCLNITDLKFALAV